MTALRQVKIKKALYSSSSLTIIFLHFMAKNYFELLSPAKNELLSS
jgi:hypothetical protein